MKLKEVMDELGLEYVCGELDKEVVHGYTCDLLSEVMGNAKPDTLWVTVQSHMNIIAVATITGIRGIILCNGHDYDEQTIKKAKEEGITLFKTQENSFVVSGKLYALGLR